jgi:hypothetical protein
MDKNFTQFLLNYSKQIRHQSNKELEQKAIQNNSLPTYKGLDLQLQTLKSQSQEDNKNDNFILHCILSSLGLSVENSTNRINKLISVIYRQGIKGLENKYSHFNKLQTFTLVHKIITEHLDLNKDGVIDIKDLQAIINRNLVGKAIKDLESDLVDLYTSIEEMGTDLYQMHYLQPAFEDIPVWN